MGDENLEARLAKYRPVGPTEELRERVMSTCTEWRTGWMSVAALLFIIVVLQALAAGERAAVRARLDDSSGRERLVRELAEHLGGDEFAFQTASALIEMSASAGDAK